MEYLAYLEHRRWVEERLRNGWTWGEKRDDVRRTHPDLVPYDELSEASKALGVREATITTRLYRARQRLAHALGTEQAG